ncbi:DUF3445 domain-containing protein [Parasedimentitalea marina]|uniref:DUF3445 domain-containing protein n=1 Tax=Parasedimentitalea marina TaxID=2483033 RepID=A0A3T0N514_9RHOB|nr:DUF3445 domain-containing protein [Parasedimentitalea marina]AZV79072.1 DUF3445 domain-containing protein [Parasedimentitalea marina]
MDPILQKQIPYNPLMQKALPGIQPLAMQDWLRPDDVFAAQTAARAQLLDTRREDVLMLDVAAMPAAQELLRMVLAQLYAPDSQQVQPGDGPPVTINWEDPLGTLGRIAQQDFCILEKRGDEHVMTGAVLCFPASWQLAEKFMAPLTGIHTPIASYDASIAARVQRLFDGVQPGRPLWRFNSLWYRDAELHQPRRRYKERDDAFNATAGYMRSEKQMIIRLPETRAVVFCIHTYVLARKDLVAQWGTGPAAEIG